MTIGGLRATTIDQTILDMAAVVRSDKAYRRVVREALVQDLTTYEDLVAFADASAGVPGIRRLRRELETPARTRSMLEDDVLERARAHGLDPDQNRVLHGVEVDLFLAEYNLAIEVDGPVHDNPIAQEDDARKQAMLERNGVRVVRVSRTSRGPLKASPTDPVPPGRARQASTPRRVVVDLARGMPISSRNSPAVMLPRPTSAQPGATCTGLTMRSRGQSIGFGARCE